MKKKRVLVIGAGEAGMLIARELRNHPRSVLLPVAFIDDSPQKKNLSIEDIPVVGTVDDIPSKVDELGIDEILIAIPSATGKQIRKIISACRNTQG